MKILRKKQEDALINYLLKIVYLDYWRIWGNKRTLFHIGQSYSISERVRERTIVKIEDILVKSGLFALPGKKALFKSDPEYEVILRRYRNTHRTPKKKQKKYYLGKKNDRR